MLEVFLNIEWLPHEILRHCETKKASTENSEIPFLCINFYENRIFVKHWKVAPRNFLALWYKKLSTAKRDARHLLSIYFLPYYKMSNIQKGPVTKFLGNVRQKNIRQKHDAPLLCINFFDTRIFWNTKRFCYENFLVLWDKNCSTENREIPFSCKKHFDTRSFLICFWSTISFGIIWDKKIQRKLVIPIFSITKWKSVLELIFVKKSSKIRFETLKQ